MKRLLITGGSGFLGGHLITHAYSRYDVVATYNRHQFTMPGVQWELLDLNDIDAIEPLIRRVQPHAIIHGAAISSVDECEIDNALAYRVHVQASEQLAAISQADHIRLIYISSDMVYQGDKGNYKEDDPTAAVNYYGCTKVLAEQAIARRCSNYVVARSALIYGRAITQSNSFSESILRKIERNELVTLFYDQYRSPILVDNLAQALLELVDHSFTGTLNLGGSERMNRYDFGLEMARVYNFSDKLLIPKSMFDFKNLAQQPRDVSMDISKVQSVLKTSFLDCRDGLMQSYTHSYPALSMQQP